MTSNERGISRRTWLRAALGTSLLGVPLLRPRAGHAEVRAPRRLVLVFSPNGTIQDAFWPTVVGGESDFILSEITQPLAPFQSRLLFLEGLSISVAEVGPGGPHQKGVGGLFTNAPLQEGSFIDGDGSRAGWANGISVDQELAKHIGGSTYLPSLELGVRAMDNEVRSRISYSGAGNPMPPVNEPLAAFQRLFGRFLSIDEGQRQQRQSVLDVVKQQYDLVRPALASLDRQKLEQHMELVRGIERRMDMRASEQCLPPDPPGQLAADSDDTMAAIAPLQMQLLAAAFACDLTRVASVQFSTAINEIRYPWLGSTGSGHTLSHAGPSDLDARQQMIVRRRWIAEQLAELMTTLDAIPEGEGSVLDNTLIVWGNELGRGNTHTHTNIPFLLAGGAGGALRMGRVIDFGGRPHGQLLVSLLHAFGVPAETFGHPDYASGPLSDLT